jgi:hypothetical protein
LSGVSGAIWLVSEFVREKLGLNSCETLLLEADSCGSGLVREPKGRETSAVGNRYRTTASEDVTVCKTVYCKM